MSVKPFYALYVEKEMVGKRIQSTKVKVSWKFACGPELNTQEVQLKHSLISGKREIKMNGNSVFSSKKSQEKSQPFRKSFTVMNLTVTINIEDGVNGYVYDLLLNGTPFHKTSRITVYELEQLRKQMKERKKRDSTHRLDYNEFVGSSRDLAEPSKKEEKLVEENLLDLDQPVSTVPTTAAQGKGTNSEFGASDWTTFESPPRQNEWSAIQNTSELNPFDDRALAHNITNNSFGIQDLSFAQSEPPQTAFNGQHQPPFQSSSVLAANQDTTGLVSQLQGLDFSSYPVQQPLPGNTNLVDGYATHGLDTFGQAQNEVLSAPKEPIQPTGQVAGLNSSGSYANQMNNFGQAHNGVPSGSKDSTTSASNNATNTFDGLVNLDNLSLNAGATQNQPVKVANPYASTTTYPYNQSAVGYQNGELNKSLNSATYNNGGMNPYQQGGHSTMLYPQQQQGGYGYTGNPNGNGAHYQTQPNMAAQNPFM